MPVPGGMKAGKVAKPCGIQGEVYLILEPGAEKIIEAGHPLFIDMNGQRVPFFIEELEVTSDRQAIIRFEFIRNLDDAREISGNEAYFDPATVPGELTAGDPYENLIGYGAFERGGDYLGRVTDYLAHESNPLLVIDRNGQDFYVPAVQQFIIRIDQKERSVHLHLPDGLTAL